MARKWPTLVVQVWQSDDGSIHLSCNDQRLTDEHGSWKGMNIQISRRRQPATHRWLQLLIDRHNGELPKVPRPRV